MHKGKGGRGSSSPSRRRRSIVQLYGCGVWLRFSGARRNRMNQRVPVYRHALTQRGARVARGGAPGHGSRDAPALCVCVYVLQEVMWPRVRLRCF